MAGVMISTQGHHTAEKVLFGIARLCNTSDLLLFNLLHFANFIIQNSL